LHLEEAFKAVKLANENKTHLNFAYHAAMNPLSVQAKEKISEVLKEGDSLVSFKVIFREDVRNYHGNNSWIFEPSISGGGCLIDSGVNAISVVEHIGVGHVVPTKVALGYNPDSGIKVEIKADVELVSDKNPDVKGELIQDWLHIGEEKREISVRFKSGRTIAFDNAVGTVSTTHADGRVEVHQTEQKTAADHHLTPMAHEYINVVNAAIEQFATDNYVDELGYGPFKTVMQCYAQAPKQ